MPITKSAKKALRQNLRRGEKNLNKKRELKNVIKEYKRLVGVNKMEEAKEQLSKIYKSLDKAAKTNLIKNNKASRLKSQLGNQLKTKSTNTSS